MGMSSRPQMCGVISRSLIKMDVIPMGNILSKATAIFRNISIISFPFGWKPHKIEFTLVFVGHTPTQNYKWQEFPYLKLHVLCIFVFSNKNET